MSAASESTEVGTKAKVERYISALYEQVDFSGSELLAYDVFHKAVEGYLNLQQAGMLNAENQIISVCDFNQSSVLNRFWVIDLNSKKILFNTYVAHGQATGEDCASAFSNRVNSHQSSIGFYVTKEAYIGEHGVSLRLDGVDKGYNDAALKRDIVVHGADYVSDKFICENNRLGRSWGCPAVPADKAEDIVNTIKGGTCLFIYYPEQKYFSKSVWLKKNSFLPELLLSDEMVPKRPESKQHRTIQYVRNGVVDSTVQISTK